MLANLPRPLLRLFQRAAHFWFRLSRPLTMGVRAVALDAQGRVFLVRHSYLPGWHLPGGGVEVGETALEALTRELREEGHLELAGPPVLLGVYFNGFAARRDHVLVYVAEGVRQTHARPADREIVETGFFPVDKLPEATARASRERIAEALSGAPPSAHW